jgi:hypothetical protein
MTAEPRPRAQRKADALQRLQQEVDCWVAERGRGGQRPPRPVSYNWDGDADGDREGGPAYRLETQ